MIVPRSIRASIVAALLVAGCHSRNGVGGSCGNDNDCMPGLTCFSGTCEGEHPDAGDGSDVRDVLDVLPDTPPPPPDVQDVPLDDGAPPGDGGCVSGADAGTCVSDPVRVLTLGTQQCGTLSGASNIPTSGCQPDTRGPEDVYALHLGSPTGVALAVDPTFDAVLTIRTGCPPAGMEIACNELQGDALAPAIRAALPAGDYLVVVDEFGMSGLGGPYTLATSTFVPAANASCASASALASGARANGMMASGDSTSRLCRTTDTGSELFYAVNVPAGMQATLVATPSDTTWRAFVHAMDGCTASANCLGDTSGNAAGLPATLSVRNSGGASRMITFAVAAAIEPAPRASAVMVSVTVGP